MTNKHFFEEADEGELRIKNYTYTFDCDIVYIPPNIMDIAIFRIRNYKPIFDLVPIKINKDKVKLLQQIYAVNYSYFDKTEILGFKDPFQFVNR
jgi:hypothetical protein